MNMNLTGEAGLRWVSAGAMSLVLHVVVLALFAWSSGDNAADAVRRPEPTSAPTAAAPQPEPQESSSEPKEEPLAPKAEPQPVVSPSKPASKVRESVKDRETPKPKPTARVREEAEPNETSAFETYVVKKGDSLTHIAQGCGCTIQELAKLNGSTLKKLSNLWVGQKIKIPKR